MDDLPSLKLTVYGWLEDEFPFGSRTVFGGYVGFGEGRYWRKFFFHWSFFTVSE